MAPQIYILKSLKDQRTYTGYTQDLTVRLLEHNLGKVAATKYRRPLIVLYAEDAPTIKIAKQREKYWKSGGGRRRLKKFLNNEFPPRSN